MRSSFSEKVESQRTQLPGYPLTSRGDKQGAFCLKYQGNKYTCIISNGGGWDHVSVAIGNRNRCPTWEEMCWLKDQFFDSDEVVVQYHPEKADYVNIHPHCLHLWRCENMPKPPSIYVGPKTTREL